MSNERLKGQKTLQVTGLLEEFEKDDIKKDIDIIELFKHFGVTLTLKGKNHTGLCPWHDDSNPSLSVDREKGLYNCFGCGESGDAFSLVEKMKGYDFKESLAFLKDWVKSPKLTAPFAPKGAEQAEKQTPVKKTASTGTKPESENLPDINLSKITEYYHKRLYKNTKALEYLKTRGLENPELISKFQIGFSDGTINEKLSEKQIEKLKSSGVFSEKGSEHFKNCITFPIFDEVNQVVGIYGRNINPKSKVPHLYLKGKHRSVFNRKASKVYDEMILSESIIDSLSLISLGFQNVQPVYGTNGFTEEHLEILKNDRVKTVVLAFDNDEPGKEASDKIREKLITESFQVKIIFPPLKSSNGKDVYYKDWNEYLLNTPDKTVIEGLIKNAEVFQSEENKKDFEVKKDHLGYNFLINGVSYRVSGVKDMFISNLRVNIKAESTGDTVLKYYDNLDLYSARSRSTYSQNMGQSFEIDPKKIEKDLIVILEYLEKERDRNLISGKDREKEVELSREERELGLSFLQSVDLFQDIVDDMDILGYVGEELNKQLLYLAASSRKLDDPISVLLVSESSSGKSMLVEKISKFIPEEEVLSVTSLSDQALNYAEDLMHKFLDLSEAVHHEGIDHQLREILSGKRLSRYVTEKDPQTGEMISRQHYKPAVVSLVMSGTNYDVNPENASRCFVVNTDESKEQTRRIHEAQRDKYSLKRHMERKSLLPDIIKKHQAAQKLLQSVNIINSFAKHLSFPDTLMRTRRDHERFIDLIACVCFLRQYQKERKIDDTIEYIECDLKDYEIAYEIMINGVLSSSMLEIPKGTIQLYEELRSIVRKRAKRDNIEPHEVSITQREIREATGFGQTWLKMHLKRLVDYEYITITRGGGARSKGYYRIREDRPIEQIDLSIIPSPERISELMKSDKN